MSSDSMDVDEKPRESTSEPGDLARPVAGAGPPSSPEQAGVPEQEPQRLSDPSSGAEEASEPAGEAPAAEPLAPPPLSIDGVSTLDVPLETLDVPVDDEGDFAVSAESFGEARDEAGEDPGDGDRGEAGQGDFADEGTQVLDDLEDIEDIEELELDAEELNEAPAAAPPPKAPPPKAPPPPPRARPRAPSVPPVTAPAAPAVTLAPLEAEIATPTVLDRAVAELGEGTWRGRAEALVQAIEASADPDLIAAMAYELGELYERRLGDEAEAVKAYNRALQADPSLRANLWAIRRVFYRRGLWPNLLKLIDAEIDYAQSDEERADLYVEKGQILEDRLDDADAARVAYEYALDLIAPGAESPAAVQALMGLERLMLAAGDDDGLERVWERLAESVGDPARKLVYVLERARSQAGRGDAIQALDTLADAVALGVDPGRVARERLRIAELAQDPDAVLAALEAQIAHLAARATDGEAMDDEATRMRVVALRRRQAQVAQALGADRPDEREAWLERAWEVLNHALSLAPSEPLVLADLSEVAEQLGRHEELAALCERWETQAGAAAGSVAMSLRRAEALLRAGKHEETRALVDALAGSAPGYLPVTALAERHALVTGDWALLARTYLAAAAAARAGSAFAPGPASGEPDGEPEAEEGEPGDAAWAASLYVSAGDVLAHEAGDPEQAGGAYEQALAAVPGYAPAVEALCALHERRGDTAAAAALLEPYARQAEAGEDPRARHLLERLVRLYEDLGDPERALEAQRRLFALDPDSPQSLRLGWRMEAALASLGRTAERVELLVDLADRQVDPAHRGAALYSAARMCDQELDDPARAAELYREVLAMWPGDRYARAALIALLRRAGQHEELAAEREAEAAELADGPGLARALGEAAFVLHSHLQHSERAAELYRRLLERMPGHAGALRGLAELLASAADSDEAPGELIDVLEQESLADGPEETRAVAALRLAVAHERAGRVDDALEAYRRAAELAPGSALATAAMVELAAASGDEFSYIDALNQLAQGRPDPEVRSGLLEDVGWLWATAVEDADRAVVAFDEAARLDPSRPGPLLARLLVQARQGATRGDHPGAGETLAQLAEVIDAPAASAAMLLRAAAIAEGEADIEGVQDRLFAALSHAPEDQSTLMVAAEYAAAQGPEEVTAEQLAGRAELFAMRASLADNAASRRDWELCRAEALEGAGQLRLAAQIALAVREDAARDRGAANDQVRALLLVRRVCGRGGDRAGLARASVALAQVLGDPASACALWREAAAIFDSELGDSAAAVPVYRHLLLADPGAPELERLLEIYREHDDVRALFEVISARLRWLGDLGVEGDEATRAALASLHYERAVLRQRVGDHEGAVRDLAAVLAVEPGHAPALWAQARAMVAAGEPATAAELVARYLEVETDPARRTDAELALAQLLAEDLGDVAGAVARLDSVIAREPDDVAVRERALALVVQAEQWDRAVEELGEIARRQAEPGARARYLLRAAEILEERLRDQDRAAAALAQARELDPLDIDVVRRLAGLTGGDERDKMLGRAARDVHKAIAEQPARVELYQRLAAVYDWQAEHDGRYYALCAVQVLGGPAPGEPAPDRDAFVEARARALAQVALPSAALSDDDWRAGLGSGAEGRDSAAGDVWAVIAEAVTRALDLEPGKLGFGRGDKVSGRGLAKRFPAVHAVLEAFGVAGAELYISDTKPGDARVLSLAKPVVCLGADVAGAESAAHRFLLGRAVAHARAGTGSLLELDGREVAVFVAAAAQVAGVSLPDGLAGQVAEDKEQVEARARDLHKHLGRRDRRALGQVFERLSALGDPAAWWRGAVSTGARAGLLLAGDVSAAVEILRGQHQGQGAPAQAPVVLDLLSWMVSREHLALRRRLGMATETKDP